MADLVNDTAKSQLSPRNQEPSHLTGVASSTYIGGKGVQDPANSDSIRVDGAKGMSTDNSIPKSVGAEGTHLTTVINSPVNKDDEGDGEPDVVFDDGDDDPITESDDLDKQLDMFEDMEPVEIDVKTSKDSDKKDDDDEDDKGKKKNPFEKKNPFVKEDDERGDNNGKTAASFGPTKTAVASGGNKTPLPEDGDMQDDDKLEEEESPMGGDGEAPDTEKNAKGPAAAMNKNGSGTVSESLKIKITLPSTALFESVGLSSKAQTKMAALYESAIKDVTKQVSTQVNAHYKKLHEHKIAQFQSVMTKQVDNYLGYVVEEWVKQNKVAIRTSLRSQMAESLLDGLKTLFTEHYVDVPQSKVDILKKLTEEVRALKTATNKLTEDKMKLRRLAEAANKARIVAQFARNAKLSEAQITKLEKLAENTQYTTAKEFREKLSMLRESYFPAEKPELKTLGEEAVVVPDATTGTATDPLVTATLAASKAMSTSQW